MNLGLLFVVSLFLQAQLPQAGPPAPVDTRNRMAVIGATIISGFEKDSKGKYLPILFEDSSLTVEDGKVDDIVSRQNFKLGSNEVPVLGKNRFAISAPIFFGTGNDDGAAWLMGRNLMAASVHGMGYVALPAKVVESPAGRCAQSRVDAREFPGAYPLPLKPNPNDVMQGAWVEASVSDSLGSPDEFTKLIGDKIKSLQEAGFSNSAILAGMTSDAGQRLGKSDLGVITPGARGIIVVTDVDPLIDPMAILDPYAIVFGDRVLRRNEIEVLRGTLGRSKGEQVEASTMNFEGGATNTNRWLMSISTQIFGRVLTADDEKGIRYKSRQGAPRNDLSVGRVGNVGFKSNVAYTGPPQNFEIGLIPNENGIGVELQMEGATPITADSPGFTSPPLLELVADLLIRADQIAAGELEFEAQELIYGSGPIGLAPRKIRLSRIDPTSCPPCFEGAGSAWKMEVLDMEAASTPVTSVAFVLMKDGVPNRIRIESPYGPSWYERIETGTYLLD